MKGKTSHSDDDNEWEGNVKYKVKAEMEGHDHGKLKVILVLSTVTHQTIEISIYGIRHSRRNGQLDHSRVKSVCLRMSHYASHYQK